jgi:hypothetical protein
VATDVGNVDADVGEGVVDAGKGGGVGAEAFIVLVL